MRAYRPSHFAEEPDPENSLILADSRRLRRIVVYAQRVRKGQPLFEESVDVPVRHLPDRRRTAKAG